MARRAGASNVTFAMLRRYVATRLLDVTDGDYCIVASITGNSEETYGPGTTPVRTSRRRQRSSVSVVCRNAFLPRGRWPGSLEQGHDRRPRDHDPISEM